MTRPFLLLLTAFLVAGPVAAQTPSVTPFGQGCRGPLLLPDRYDPGQGMWVPTQPSIGKTLYVSAPWAPDDYVALLLVGKSNTKWLNSSLPLTVPTNFAPAYQTGPCLLTSIELIASGILWYPYGKVQDQRWIVAFPIPKDTTLVGLRFYMQWAIYRANTVGGFQAEMAWSAGAKVVVGQ